MRYVRRFSGRMRHMFELPLFPLNSVLFPGMPIHLHIFEERYKSMIQRCIAEDKPFGVVLIAEGLEAHGPLALPHRIGCTARITRVENLNQGRMNIAAIGGERFQIEALDDTTYPYLVGQVSLLPMPVINPDLVSQESRRLRKLVAYYLAQLAKAGQTSVSADQLPENPLIFANLAAAILQTPAEQRQPLLAAESVEQFLSDLNVLYRREITLLSILLETPQKGRGTGDIRLN